MPIYQRILRLAQPIELLLLLLTYGLGLGIARYLGQVIRVESQLFGGLILLLMLAAAHLLAGYFRPAHDPVIPANPEISLAEHRKSNAEIRPIILTVSFALIAVAAILAFFMGWQGLLSMPAGLMFILFLVLCVLYAVPPFRLLDQGFGELLVAFLVAGIAPTTAFLLQAPKLHRLLVTFTFPLFLLAIVYLLALGFSTYSDDLKFQRRTLLLRLSWQRAVWVHNILLAGAYLFLAFLPFVGIPLPLIWPGFLTLPLAAYQIFMLRRITDGAKPIWSAFTINGIAIFGLTAYLLTLTFWLR